MEYSLGSWGKKNYTLTYSGSVGKNKDTKFFLSLNDRKGGNSKFKDGKTKEVGVLPISSYSEKGANLRIDKEFGNGRSLKVWYNHQDGKDGYPVATPSLTYWNEKDWYRILFEVMVGRYDQNHKLTEKGKYWSDAKQPGYHNIYLARAINNVTTEYNHNDLDLVYTFKNVNGKESFVRLYNQSHIYRTRSDFKFANFDGYTNSPGIGYSIYEKMYPNGATEDELMAFMKAHLIPFPSGESTLIAKWRNATGGNSAVTDWHKEKNRGIELQFSHDWKQHEFIFGLLYDKASHITNKKQKDGSFKNLEYKRDSLFGYIQDKIHVTESWDITPALRYSRYSGYKTNDTGENLKEKGVYML